MDEMCTLWSIWILWISVDKRASFSTSHSTAKSAVLCGEVVFSTLPTMYYFYCFCITILDKHSFLLPRVDNPVAAKPPTNHSFSGVCLF